VSITVKKQLLDVSSQLTAEKVRAVVDFAEFLLAKSKGGRTNGARKDARALRRYVGGVKDGGLASGIDDTLYGQPVR
jgi:hypothetical protein